MADISINYGPVIVALDDMSQQARRVTHTVEDLVRKVGAVAQVFHGQASASYQAAQNQANQGIEQMNQRLTAKIIDARNAVEIYDHTDAPPAGSEPVAPVRGNQASDRRSSPHFVAVGRRAESPAIRFSEILVEEFTMGYDWDDVYRAVDGGPDVVGKEFDAATKEKYGDPDKWLPTSNPDVTSGIGENVNISQGSDDLASGSLQADTASMRKYGSAMQTHADELGRSAINSTTSIHVSAGDFLEAANLQKQAADLIAKAQAGIGAWQTNVRGAGAGIVDSAQAFEASDAQASEQVRS
jgi:WXG100 family type VII secretion target